MDEKDLETGLDDQPMDAVSRRELLQLLGASGLVVGLERLLPADWVKPEVGKVEEDLPLPALQSMGALLIDNMTLTWSKPEPVNATQICNGRVLFYYDDEDSRISINSALFAADNAFGLIYNDVPIHNVGGQVWPKSTQRGAITFPLPFSLPLNKSGTFGVLIADNEEPRRASNTLLTEYFACQSVQLSDFNHRACSPFVTDNMIYCAYQFRVDYFDPSSKISSASTVTLAQGDKLLLNQVALSELGQPSPNPTSGVIGINLAIPQGQEGLLTLIVTNDDGISGQIENASPLPSQCGDRLPLVAENSSAFLVDNEAFRWQIGFAFNDSAGLTSNDTLVSAGVFNGTLLLDQTPLNNAGGGILVLGDYNSSFGGVDGCPPVEIAGTFGRGQFELVYNTADAFALQGSLPNATLQWFLTDGPNKRDSNLESVILPGQPPPPPPQLNSSVYIPAILSD